MSNEQSIRDELINLGVCIKNQADRLGIEHDGIPLEGVVVRIAERALSVVAEEPEWQYGVRATGDSEPFTDHYESLDAMSEEFDGRVVWNTDEEIVRRRKAGPWEPIP